MKTLRYFLMLLAAGALFTGCSDDDELSKQNVGKTKPTVTLTQDAVTDTQFTFTLTASAEAQQYGYALFKGEGNAAPIAYDIVVDEVSGAAVAGVFNAADNASQTITINCSSDAHYQIFAAAITSTGLLGEVSELTIYVPDTTSPRPATFSTSGNTATVTFSEEIRLSQSAGSATVRYIQWGIGMITDPVEIPRSSISASGKVATFVCPKPAAGAGYMVSFTEGLFEDASGNPAPGINSTWNNDTHKYVNIGWNDANVDFAILDSYFVEPAEDVNWYDPATTIDFVFPFDVYDSGVKNAVSVIYDEAAGTSTLYTTYTLDADKRTVHIALPKVPSGRFDVQIAQGAFYDIWANETAAYKPASLRWSNFSVELQLGDYQIDYTNANGDPDSFMSKLVQYDDTYYALYAVWFGAFNGYANPILLGKADYANSQIVFDGTYLSNGQPSTRSAFGGGFYYYDQAQTMMLAFWGGGNSGTEPVVIDFDEDGYMTAISYCDYSVHNASSGAMLGVFDSLNDGKMTFVPEEAAAAPTKSKELPHFVELSRPAAARK